MDPMEKLKNYIKECRNNASFDYSIERSRVIALTFLLESAVGLPVDWDKSQKESLEALKSKLEKKE